MDIDINNNYNIYDDFLDILDKTIISGDTKHIENFMRIYGNNLHPDSIKLASDIVIQILQEKMEDIVLTS